MDTKDLQIRLDDQGMVTAICQDAESGAVLMVGHMTPESIRRTFSHGQMVFYSRSRQELWHKGSTSGSVMDVVSASLDCDGDALLFQVKPRGPACHTGEPTCFFRPLEPETQIDYRRPQEGPAVLHELYHVVRDRQRQRPEGSYTAQLFEAGTSRIAQKVVEEGAELALAAATGDQDRIPAEAADLLFHALVLLADAGLSPNDVWRELRHRRR